MNYDLFPAKSGPADSIAGVLLARGKPILDSSLLGIGFCFVPARTVDL